MMTAKRRIKLGMVGGGEGSFIGAIHRIASRIDDRYELVAGALSSDEQRASDSGRDLGIPLERCYSSFQEMAVREKERVNGIDAVSIVTPNHLHYPVARAFLEQGIAVICDKPITLNLEQAIKLKELQSETDGFFSLTHNYTGYPLVRHARQMVEQGELGKLRVIQVEYVQDWLTHKEEDSDNKQAQWRTDPARSGPAGCLGDIGTHAFNLARFMSGLKATAVSADLHTFVEGRRLDDNAHLMLRFDNGAKGMLWASQVAPGNENGLKIRLFGDKGGLEWAQENPNELWFSPFGHPTRRLTRGGHDVGEIAARITRTPAGHPEGYLEGFANIYSDIADALLLKFAGLPLTKELELIPGIDEGISGMKFLETAITSSQRNSAWVDLDA